MARQKKPAKAKDKNLGGRPKINLGAEDLNLMAICCQMHCTQEETAAIMGISVDTIDRRLTETGTTWTEFHKTYTASGRASLRRTTWHRMESSPEPMERQRCLEALQREHLGFKDRKEIGFDPEKPAVFKLNMGKKLPEGDLDDEG